MTQYENGDGRNCAEVLLDKTTYLVYTVLSEKANYSEITVGRNRNGQKR
jgi:hypothetical protein